MGVGTVVLTLLCSVGSCVGVGTVALTLVSCVDAVLRYRQCCDFGCSFVWVQPYITGGEWWCCDFGYSFVWCSSPKLRAENGGAVILVTHSFGCSPTLRAENGGAVILVTFCLGAVIYNGQIILLVLGIGLLSKSRAPHQFQQGAGGAVIWVHLFHL